MGKNVTVREILERLNRTKLGDEVFETAKREWPAISQLLVEAYCLGRQESA
jgi:hypothetical protein